MEINVIELKPFYNILKKVGRDDLSIKKKYKIALFLNEIREKLSIFEKLEKEIISKYAEKDINNKPIRNGELQYKINNSNEFNEKIEELYNKKIELDNFIQFDLDELKIIDSEDMSILIEKGMINNG